MKFETIENLLALLKNYRPVYLGSVEKQRLEHYRDVIQEDIAFIVASIIRDKVGLNDE